MDVPDNHLFRCCSIHNSGRDRPPLTIQTSMFLFKRAFLEVIRGQISEHAVLLPSVSKITDDFGSDHHLKPCILRWCVHRGRDSPITPHTNHDHLNCSDFTHPPQRMVWAGRRTRRRVLCDLPDAGWLRRSSGDGFSLCQWRLQATHRGVASLSQPDQINMILKNNL